MDNRRTASTTTRARRSAATMELDDDDARAFSEPRGEGPLERNDAACTTPVATRGGAGQSASANPMVSSDSGTPETPGGDPHAREFANMLFESWPHMSDDVDERVKEFEAFAKTILRVIKELEKLREEGVSDVTFVKVYAELARHAGIHDIRLTPKNERSKSSRERYRPRED